VIEAEYNESTRAWITEPLRMGPRTYLAHLLNWNRRKKINNTLLLTDPF
jgi:hypothetical protein